MPPCHLKCCSLTGSSERLSGAPAGRQITNKLNSALALLFQAAVYLNKSACWQRGGGRGGPDGAGGPDACQAQGGASESRSGQLQHVAAGRPRAPLAESIHRDVVLQQAGNAGDQVSSPGR